MYNNKLSEGNKQPKKRKKFRLLQGRNIKTVISL